jgi:hypothetical protein
MTLRNLEIIDSYLDQIVNSTNDLLRIYTEEKPLYDGSKFPLEDRTPKQVRASYDSYFDSFEELLQNCEDLDTMTTRLNEVLEECKAECRELGIAYDELIDAYNSARDAPKGGKTRKRRNKKRL